MTATRGFGICTTWNLEGYKNRKENRDRMWGGAVDFAYRYTICNPGFVLGQ